MVSDVLEVGGVRRGDGDGANGAGRGEIDMDGGVSGDGAAFDVAKVGGIGEYGERREKGRVLYLKGEKVFLVVNARTIEVRTDAKLGALLREKYESVMESRYFGRGGIEVVLAGQLSEGELCDLVRLSWNLT